MLPGVNVGSLHDESGELSQRVIGTEGELTRSASDFAFVGRLIRAAGAFVVCIALVHPAVAQIPGATLTQITNLTPPAYPRSLAAGADGKVWFAEERLTPHSVGFFDAGGKVTKFPVPCDRCDGNGDQLAYIESITVGPDGNAWFPYSHVNGDGAPLSGLMNNFIGRFTPAGQFTSFPVLTADAFRRFSLGQPGHSAITSGPDGNLWFTENIPGKIGKITTAGVITEYPLPSPLSAPSIMTKGPDGNLWFTEMGAGKIGRVTTAGAITEFAAPRGTTVAAPFGITTGADGNLWYTDWSGAIGRMTPAGVGTRFEILEPRSVPNNITTGPDGKLYFPYFTFIGTAGDYQGKIAQLDPATASAPGVVINFSLFPNKAFGNEIVVGPSVVAPSSGSFAVLPAGMVPSTISWKLNVSGSRPDLTGVFVDILFALIFAPLPDCNPPITFGYYGSHGGPSPFNTPTVTARLGKTDLYSYSANPILNAGPVESPYTISLSGDVPPGIEEDSYQNNTDPKDINLRIFGVPTVPGVYRFALTIKDGRGCTAVVNYTFVISLRKGDVVNTEDPLGVYSGGRNP